MLNAELREILDALDTASKKELAAEPIDWYTARLIRRTQIKMGVAMYGTTQCDCGIMRATCARCCPILDDTEVPEGTAPSRGNQGHLGVWVNLDRAQYARTL